MSDRHNIPSTGLRRRDISSVNKQTQDVRIKTGVKKQDKPKGQQFVRILHHAGERKQVKNGGTEFDVNTTLENKEYGPKLVIVHDRAAVTKSDEKKDIRELSFDEIQHKPELLNGYLDAIAKST